MNRGSLPKRIPNNTRNYTHSNTTNVNPHSMGSLIKALEKKTEEIHISSEKIAENNREMELQRKIQNLEKEVLRLNRKLDEKDKQLNDYNKRVAILEKENQSLKRKQNYQPVEDDLAIALERINEMESKQVD